MATIEQPDELEPDEKPDEEPEPDESESS